MVSHIAAERASRLGLILTPSRDSDGKSVVQVRRGSIELASVPEAELVTWLAAQEVQRRHDQATDSR